MARVLSCLILVLVLPAAAAAPDGADRDHDGIPDAAELADPVERDAFRKWLCALALRQAEGGLPAAGTFRAARDCADLLDIAFREALKRHDQAWRDKAGWTGPGPGRDVWKGYPRPVVGTDIFRVGPDAFGPYATAEVLRELNARRTAQSIDRTAVEDGDVLFFQHPWQVLPDHGMLVCGGLAVYHTGPTGNRPGRVKAVTLERLLQHPDPRWRPLASNPYFLGVYRWHIVD
ncbi:MAG: DUF1175 family protein [Elusimicrobia bacterium]|nr:DUF1175 family protein [Elusimicrobiota bacterium]